MKTPIAVAVAVLLSAPLALARGKSFDEGLSKEEVTRLTKSLGAMEAKYLEAKPSMDKLKKNPEVRKAPRLTQAAVDVLRSYTTIGVFLAEMDAGLKKRDPKVNSFELQLKGEIDQFELRLAALNEQATAARAGSVGEIIAGTIVLAAALDTLFVAFDSAYDVALVDVDLVLVPTFDVYEVVHFTSPYVVLDERDPATTWQTAAGYDEE